MAQIHNLESKTRYGTRYVAGFIILISSILLAGWFAFFIFLPIKSSMEVVTALEEKFLPRAEGMVLNFVSLSEPSTIITSDNQILDELHDGLNRDPISLSEVPSFVVNTLLAAEDSNYYLHEGVDFVAILSAVLDNLRGVTRGGSTITSQVAKQSFVGDEISVRRKVAEAVVAAELERRYTKDQILEYYINSIYWGSGAYGIQSASYEYFGKDIREITLDEAATLVVIIRSPAYYNPRKYPDRVIERRNDVLNIMLKEGFIVDIQARSAKLAPLNVIDSVQIDSQAEHVVAEVKRQLLNDPQFAVLGSTKEERKKKIFGCPSDDTSCTGGGGLSVYITLNLEFQKHANQILNKWVPSENFDDESDEPKPTGVITLLNNLTGGIEVMASGIPFEEEQYNLATQGKRNPGSAFKPITLLAALESGSKLYSYRDSRSPVEIDCGYPCAPDGVGTKWVVRNYGTSITADRYLNKIPAQDRAIELQCVGYHIEDIKNLDFIKQFPLVSNLDELEDEDEANRMFIQLYSMNIRGVELEGKQVLEVGSGRGGGASWIAKTHKPAKLTGVDFSAEAVGHCQSWYADQSNLEFIEGNAQDLPFDDATFDVVYNVESSHCYGDMGAFVEQAFRVLKPGGRFCWTDLRDAKTMDTLPALFESKGFEIVESADVVQEVLLALDEINETKMKAIEEKVPNSVRRSFETFAGVKGTPVYEGFVSGSMAYHRHLMLKP